MVPCTSSSRRLFWICHAIPCRAMSCLACLVLGIFSRIWRFGWWQKCSNDGACNVQGWPIALFEPIFGVPVYHDCNGFCDVWKTNRYKRYRLSEGKDFSSLFFPEKPGLLRILQHFEEKSGQSLHQSVSHRTHEYRNTLHSCVPCSCSVWVASVCLVYSVDDLRFDDLRIIRPPLK